MDKTVFISGASSGFGAALASLYAKAGDAVVLAARRMDRLEVIVRQISEDGGKALAVQCDVKNRQNVLDAVRQGQEAFGPIDLMIANAGVIYKTKARSFSGEAFEKTMRVNLLGAAYCFKAVLPVMIERNQGHLVGVSSLAGYRGQSLIYQGWGGS